MKKLLGLKKRDKRQYQAELVRRARKAAVSGPHGKRAHRDDYVLTRPEGRADIDSKGRFVFVKV